MTPRRVVVAASLILLLLAADAAGRWPFHLPLWRLLAALSVAVLGVLAAAVAVGAGVVAVGVMRRMGCGR